MPWQPLPKMQVQFDVSQVRSHRKTCPSSAGSVNSNQARGNTGSTSGTEEPYVVAGRGTGCGHGMMVAMDDSAPTVDDDPDPRPSTGRRILLGIGLAVLVAVTWWLFGQLPWVLSGFSWTTTRAVPVGSSTE